jgi:hypothetical protein
VGGIKLLLRAEDADAARKVWDESATQELSDLKEEQSSEEKSSAELALNCERDSISSTKAQRRDAALQVAALQFIKQGDENARAACSNRMP